MSGASEVRRIFFPCKGDGTDRPVTFFPRPRKWDLQRNPRIFSKSCDVEVPKAGDEERALVWIGSGGFDEAGMRFVLIRPQDQKSEVRVEERVDISVNF